MEKVKLFTDNMIEIKEAGTDNFEIIKEIAYKTWPSTYGNILSPEQLDYMLSLFYSVDALNENTRRGDCFLIAWRDEIPLGFASYHHNYKNLKVTRIPKIYVIPSSQGKGIGKSLLVHIAKIAVEQNSDRISLNVNRFNKALHFYLRLGFEITAEENIPLEHGYIMEDYIMEKKV